MHDHKPITLNPCPHTIEADCNTLDMCQRCKTDHYFLRQMTYDDRGWDGLCLTCGLRVHVHNGQVVEAWGNPLDIPKKEKHNQALDERLNDLEHQIKNERLKREGDVKFCEGQITKLLENLLTIKGQIYDLLDCLEMDGNQIEKLRKAFSLHRELRFHFMDRKGDKK